MSIRLTLEKNDPVTHDTHHLVFTRPESFEITPGQAVDMTLLREGLRDEARPFTPVAMTDDTLEFVIKSYPDHDGVTKEIPTLRKGEMVEISEPWGAIHDEGAGTFIAGGAGITPFLAILNARLERKGTLEGSKLIFSNKTEEDIICREELEAMTGLETVFTVTDQEDAGVETDLIDRAFLEEHCDPAAGPVYVCGPDKMIEDIVGHLKDMGVPEDQIIIEQFD
ncbi:FAD-binding oxidoreductase [Celeribacter litoreus]|uniref:FAD-binding oxidoreductase n=1 Tax=Celeribacter litoreus TaxID=2876714 RepID=UPI001CCF3312|nr:FAD-binding oxidoreductase [Celeribacter litoreus]MCA0044170.1 flavodoxin reductase [Celeribacter litoreus]